MAAPKTYGVRLGGDPEFFLKDMKTGRIVPSCDLIGGDKGKGLPLGVDSSWLEDNVAVELNFSPCPWGDDFGYRLLEFVPHVVEQLKGKNLLPHFAASHKFSLDQLANPKAMVFGCDPDFCAYDKDPKKAREIDCSTFSTERYCGGHLHLSFTNKDEIPLWAVVMMLDAYVGLPMVRAEKQLGRRKKYGLAGLFRPKPYGVEYRTLSNYWLEKAFEIYAMPRISLREMRVQWLNNFGYSVMAIGKAIEDDPLKVSKLFSRLPVRDIRKAINDDDKTEAQEIYAYCRNLPEVKELNMWVRVGSPI